MTTRGKVDDTSGGRCGCQPDRHGSTDATTAACLRRGWLATRGVAGVYPSGKPYMLGHITDEGIGALAVHLLAIYHARPMK